jgi:hypothetical protein
MALTLAVRMEATILDELDIQAETSVYALVDPTASFDTILGQFNAWLADLDACTDGQIIEARLDVLPALPGGLKTGPVALSRVEQTGILAFDAAGDTHKWATAIPALSNSPTVIEAGKVVTTVGSPAQVLAALLAGGGTAALAWTNAVNQAITAATSALISFRRYSHQMVEETYERVNG